MNTLGTVLIAVLAVSGALLAVRMILRVRRDLRLQKRRQEARDAVAAAQTAKAQQEANEQTAKAQAAVEAEAARQAALVRLRFPGQQSWIRATTYQADTARLFPDMEVRPEAEFATESVSG